MNSSAQVAQLELLGMPMARIQPLQVDNESGPRQETSDSESVIGESLQVGGGVGAGGGGGAKDQNGVKPFMSIPAAGVAPYETACKRLTESKIIATAGANEGEDQRLSSSSGLASIELPISRRQADNEINNAVAIRMDSNQQEPIDNNNDNVKKQKPLRTTRKRSGIFFNPSDSKCYWWSAIVSLAFLYNFWSLSYRVAFSEIDSSTIYVWFAFDYTADLIYLLDILVMIRTGYLEDGVLQRDKIKIRAHYKDSTLFYLDSSCLLPFDILYLSFGFSSILRCNRLIKIHKFWSFVDRTERHTNYPNVFRTFTLVHYILVIFHWNACIFNMISEKINDIKCEDISCKYLHAFYWSTLALTIIGGLPRPQVHSEYIFVIVELFFGLFLFASVLGHVANIVTNVSAARKEFQARLDAVKTFMRTRRVSDDLQRKVIRWFDYLWISQKSSDEERSVACLPDRLKAEIAIHVNLDTLKRVDIFQATEAGFLRELVLRLKPVLFSPGDYVCRKDEAGHEMYIVSRGILEVVTNEGQTVVATFRAGSYFGEIAVLNVGTAGNKRTASVRSVGYSDLFCLSKQDLWDVLKDYPNAEARIRAVAEERLSALGGRESEPREKLTRGRGRASLRRTITAAITASARQDNQQRDGGLNKLASRTDDSLNVSDNNDDDDDDDVPKPSGRINPPLVSHQRRACSSSSTRNRTFRRATAAWPCQRGAPSSLTMEPICDRASRVSSQARPLRLAASGYGLMMKAGDVCCEYQHTAIRRAPCGALVAPNRCLCHHCHPSSAPVRLAPAAARPSPNTDATNCASLANQQSSMSSSSIVTTCAINQNAAVTTSGGSSAGGPRGGGGGGGSGGSVYPQPGGESAMHQQHSRHQLSMAGCHNHDQRPLALPLGQARSFGCSTLTGEARDDCPTTALQLCHEPDRWRSGRASATNQPEAPLTSSDATTISGTLRHTNMTTAMIERKNPPVQPDGVSGSDTTSADSPIRGAPRVVGASPDRPNVSCHLQPECPDHLRRSRSLREPHYVRSPVATAAHSDYDLEGQSEAHNLDVNENVWQQRSHHNQSRSSNSIQFEAHGLANNAIVVLPPARQQLHKVTCRKRSRPTPIQQWQEQVVIPISPTEEPRPSSRSRQSAPTDQQAGSPGFQAINPPSELHLAIDEEYPGQRAQVDGGDYQTSEHSKSRGRSLSRG